MARLVSTMLGGVPVAPIAERRIESTTTIRVNEVTMTRMPGARLKSVIRAMSWITLPVNAPRSPGPRSRVTLCAKAGWISRVSPVIPRVIPRRPSEIQARTRNRFMRLAPLSPPLRLSPAP